MTQKTDQSKKLILPNTEGGNVRGSGDERCFLKTEFQKLCSVGGGHMNKKCRDTIQSAIWRFILVMI